MKPFVLKTFQKTAVQKLNVVLQQHSAVLVQSPTGSGKTVIMSDFVRDHQHEDCLVLVPLQVLVGQTFDSFLQHGVVCEVLHDELIGTSTKDRTIPAFLDQYGVIITMPETFVNTVNGVNKMSLRKEFDPSYILIDEAHKGTTKHYQTIKAMYPSAKIVGFSATPYREKSGEGENLKEWYHPDAVIEVITIGELIANGDLVKPYYKDRHGESEIAVWLKEIANTPNPRTVIFTRDNAHAFTIRDNWKAKGIKIEAIYGTQTEDPNEDGTLSQTAEQRQQIFQRFRNGQTDVLVSTYALCEGFDEPQIAHVFLLRTVGNKSLYTQIIGRALRKHHSKTHATVWDFTKNRSADGKSNIERHGPVENITWNVDEASPNSKTVGDGASVNAKEFVKKDYYITCDDCGTVYPVAKTAIGEYRTSCPVCNHYNTIKIIKSETHQLQDETWENVFRKSTDMLRRAQKLIGDHYMKNHPSLSRSKIQQLVKMIWTQTSEAAQIALQQGTYDQQPMLLNAKNNDKALTAMRTNIKNHIDKKLVEYLEKRKARMNQMKTDAVNKKKLNEIGHV